MVFRLNTHKTPNRLKDCKYLYLSLQINYKLQYVLKYLLNV